MCVQSSPEAYNSSLFQSLKTYPSMWVQQSPYKWENWSSNNNSNALKVLYNYYRFTPLDNQLSLPTTKPLSKSIYHRYWIATMERPLNVLQCNYFYLLNLFLILSIYGCWVATMERLIIDKSLFSSMKYNFYPKKYFYNIFFI